MPALVMRSSPPQRRGPRAFRSHQPGIAFYSAAVSADMVVEVSLSNLDGDTDEECGVVYRGVDQAHFWAAYVSDSDNLIHLSKFIAGVETSVATYAWTPAATAELRVIAQETRHRVWVDRLLAIDTEDGDLRYGNRAGQFSRGTTAVLFEDFHARRI